MTKNPGQGVGVVGNPDVISTVNPNPQQSNLPQATITPQSLLSQPAQSVNNSNVSDWPVYQDTVYHFQISYPSQFEFKMLDTSELEKLKPVPVTATYFYDASTNLGGIVPPRFSIRIYKIGAGTSVENWLKTNGLYQPDSDWTIAEIPGRTFLWLPGEFASLYGPRFILYCCQR